MTTLVEVARVAGVTAATVSNVLHLVKLGHRELGAIVASERAEKTKDLTTFAVRSLIGWWAL